jgi:hypothetical protein
VQDSHPGPVMYGDSVLDSNHGPRYPELSSTDPSVSRNMGSNHG